MTEGSRQPDEAVSALIDGELSASEAERLFERVRDEPELRERWTRYHAGRAALVGHPARVSADFADRVGQRLQNEPVIIGPLARMRDRARWRPAGQTLTGFAVAASVAVVALAGLLALREPVTPDPQEPASVTDSISAAAPVVSEQRLAVPLLRPDGLATVTVAGGMAFGDTAAAEPEWLEDYVTAHTMFSGGSEMPPIILSGRLAGHRVDD